VTPDELLELFDEVADAVRGSVASIQLESLRGRTERPGQYALDVVADDAACAVLARAPVRIVSEESGVRGNLDASITVVLDPVDGSTNCARGISYWATSICALDGDGAVAALVVNQATGQRTRAVRGGGASRDGVRLRAAGTTRIEDSVVCLSMVPKEWPGCKQGRVLGSAALALIDVAAGGLDVCADVAPLTSPWDYLGGYLACIESGAVIRDIGGLPLVTDDPATKRQVLAAATPELADAIERALA
jgi:myo-inositol-1(or 4)-monophosphatase